MPIANLSDEFADAASTQQWERLHEVEGWNADQLNVYDINTTQSGRMVQQPHTAVWYQNWRGPMAFQSVTGDFAFTTEVHVTDRDDIGGSDLDDIPGDGQFSLGGAMIRTPRDITDPTSDWTPGSMANDDTNDGENYVFLSLGYGAGGNEFSLEVKTTRNSNSQLELTPLGADANTVTVQIARIGNSVLALYQLPGQDWQVHRRYTRTDMPETLQVGLVSYTDWTKASDFDPFTQNSTVLTPGVSGDPTPGEAFNPDITAGFEYARYARPDVPETFAGVNLADPNSISDAQLLSFLGSHVNIDPTAVVVDDSDSEDTDTSSDNDPSPDSADSPAADAITPEMAIGMNLTMVNDWTHSWVFRDAFKLARDFTTRAHGGGEHSFLGPPETDANGWVTSIPAATVDENGQTHIAYADSILFSQGGNPAGIYRAEWAGEGEITFIGAAVVESGTTEDGRSYALLNIPEDQTIHTRIYETHPENYIRDIQIFMPDHNGNSLEMENWQPGSDESPFHPLFLERLEPFDTLRFMQWQQVNGNDREILTSDDLRPANYANQGTTNRSTFAGVSVEYQVQLVNDLGSNAYFNMPHQADDSYVRAFAEYVRDNIHDNAQIFVEYSNEIWNFAPGYQAHRWISAQQQRPENDGLTFVDVWAQEARRDLAIWSDVFSGQEERLTRVAAGQQNNSWLTGQLLARMNGEFDAISSTSYAGLGNTSLDWIHEETTQEDVIDWVLNNSVPHSQASQAEHAALAEAYSQSLGREIQYVTYEGGSHLNAFETEYQDLIHSTQDHPRFREVYAALLNGMESLGIDMHTQYVFTSQGDPAPWGEFGVLHEMDQPLEEAHEYRALVDFINGQLQPPAPRISIVATDDTGHEFGDSAEFTVSRFGTLTESDLTVQYTVSGSATAGEDYETLSGSVVIPAGERSATILVTPILDSNGIADEGAETVQVTLTASDAFHLDDSLSTATATLLDNEYPVIGDQTMSHSDDTLEIPLVTEVSGESVSYSANITENRIANLQAEHQFEIFREDFGLNWGGQNDKWLRGNQGSYYLLPSAELFLWGGSFETSTRLAALDERFYDDPSLIVHSVPVSASVSISGSTLIIDPQPDFAGSFEVQLTATAGGIESLQRFMVSTRNATPSIEPIEDQTAPVNGQLTLDLAVSDEDGDVLSIQVQVEDSLASELRNEFGLHAVESLTNWGQNWGGQQEKWLQGNNGDWFFLLPDGSLNQWNGSFANSLQVGQLGTEFYDDPQQLLDTTPTPLLAEIVNGQLVLTPQGQVGSFDVEVTVSDGALSASTLFAVTVTNQLPELNIGNHHLAPGDVLELQLASEDADGQTLEYSVEWFADEAATLDTQHGFWSAGQYWTDYLGHDERWIRDVNNDWHYLLPGGQLFRWEGSFESSTLLADLGHDFYEDPSLLTDPQPMVDAVVENGILRLTALENFTGNIEFRIWATDGIDTVQEIILITAAEVSTLAAVDAVFENWHGLD